MKYKLKYKLRYRLSDGSIKTDQTESLDILDLNAMGRALDKCEVKWFKIELT